MKLKYTILVVEDENSIAGFICEVLKASGYNVIHSDNGRDGLMYAETYCPDMVILDLSLPDYEGIEFISSLRQWSQVPIIVVSARVGEQDKIMALDAGADDYLTKPFGTGELLARIRTELRHANKSGKENVFMAKDLVIDYEKHKTYISGKAVHLTKNEYKILVTLSRVSGKVITYDNVMRAVWGPNLITDNRILRVNMANIRRKIEDNPAEPQYIFTEIGVGYRMTENEASDCI